MKVERCKIANNDERGAIMDIVQSRPFDHATLIHSVGGARRGDHYHKETTQSVFVISGSLAALAKMPDGELEYDYIYAGDLLTNEPNEIHALIARENTLFLVLTRGPRGGTKFEDDTFRVGRDVLGEVP